MMLAETLEIAKYQKRFAEELNLRIHGQLQPLLDVDLDLPVVVLVQGLEGAAHGVQPHQAAYVVVKVHVSVLVAVAPYDHLKHLLIKREAGLFEGSSQLVCTDGPRAVAVKSLVYALPFFDVVPQVFKLMEA